MLSKRIIPCLDVRDGRTTKGIKFRNNVDIGDPVAMALPAAPTPGKMTRVAWATTAGSWVTLPSTPRALRDRTTLVRLPA